MKTKIIAIMATARDYTYWSESNDWSASCSIYTKGPYHMSAERVKEILHEYVDSSMRVDWYIRCSSTTVDGADWRVYVYANRIETKEVFCKAKEAFHAIEKEIEKAH